MDVIFFLFSGISSHSRLRRQTHSPYLFVILKPSALIELGSGWLPCSLAKPLSSQEFPMVMPLQLHNTVTNYC